VENVSERLEVRPKVLQLGSTPGNDVVLEQRQYPTPRQAFAKGFPSSDLKTSVSFIKSINW
jgi:hypothetical protein